MTKTQKKNRNLYAILVLIFVLIALIPFSFKNIKVGSKNYSKDSVVNQTVVVNLNVN